MKLSSFCVAASVLLVVAPLSASAQAVSGKGKPGYCVDSTKCAPNYSCVSVQTTRAGVTDVKQCLPMAAGMQLCTGIAPGLCPSFSTTWGTSFREISSVCAYIAPETSGGKCLTGAAIGSNNSTLTKGGLECLFVQDPSNKTASSIGVIYGCVDFDGARLLFDKNSPSDKLASKFNYSEVIAASCVNPKNPQGSNFVCSSQGTCSPKSGGSMDYKCSCNIGFSGTYCEKIINNKCYNDGVCGGGSCNLATNECTDCPAGTLGNKCAQCDPTFDSTKVCGGHGTCVPASGTSTLGAGDSGSGSSASAKTPAAGSTDGSSSSAKPVPAVGDSSAASASATVKPSNATRFLASAMYQCQCATGYSDVHCGIVVPSNSSSKSKAKNTTAAPSTGSPASSVVVSFVGVALTFAIAALSV